MKLILDGNNLVSAAYFVLAEKPGTKCSDVECLFGRMIINLSNQFVSKEIYIAWDGARGTHWRKSVNPDYKATRGEKPDLLVQALQACKNNNYKNVCLPYTEGDDVINGLSLVLDGPKTVVSSDKDFIQLLQRKQIDYLYNFISKTYREAPSHDIIMEKAIVGDGSDNIKGIHGIGIKRFLKLEANAYKDLTEDQLKIVEMNKQIIDLNLNPNLDSIKSQIIDILNK